MFHALLRLEISADFVMISDSIVSSLQVLITIYWLGRAANSCTSYNGPTLDLKEFEGLLSQMRKVGYKTRE